MFWRGKSVLSLKRFFKQQETSKNLLKTKERKKKLTEDKKLESLGITYEDLVILTLTAHALLKKKVF
jgi:hypothetical protein